MTTRSTLRNTPLAARYGSLLSAGVVVALVVGLRAVTDATITDDNAGHAADHLTVALPSVVLVALLVGVCPPPKDTRIGRAARRLVAAGLVLVSASLVLEAIGAFGYGPGGLSEIDALTNLHNTTWVVGFPAAVVLLVGLVLGGLSLFQGRPPRAPVAATGQARPARR